MRPRVLEALKAYAGRLRETGWRGIALLHGSDPGTSAATALEALEVEPRECIGVADREARGSIAGGCGLVKSPARYQELLGAEARVAVVAVNGLVRPNILAALAETVVEGGLLVIGAGPRGSWSPSPPGGRGLYKAYLLDSIRASESHIILDLQGDTVISASTPTRPAPPRPARPADAPPGLPRALAARAATRDQLEALARAWRLFKGRGRTLLLLGDRGRGKSYALGLILALLIHARQAGRIHVVAPSPHGASSLFRGLLEGLESLGLGGLARQRLESGAVVRVWGPWFSVHYQPPESAEPAPILAVDEAGAVGVARVRRLSWRSGRILAASTIHGYEGSGRALVHILRAELPRPMEEVELGEPIRYRRGDPLERWVLETFHLNAEPPEVDAGEAMQATCREVEPSVLARDRGYASGLLGILAQAHYRFEPDYILVILESPNHRVLALQAPGGAPVAAADVAVESWDLEDAARLGLKALARHATGVEGLKGYRVVRIAVTPSLQRRGLGSRLLACIEGEARREGADVVTAIFSRHDVIGFWARAGYRIVYVSPRYNKATGEKNVAVAKPLSPAGRRVVADASSNFRARFLLSLPSIYRDVSAERVAQMIEAMEAAPRGLLTLSPDMERRLRLFEGGSIDLEQAFDAVWAAVVECLLEHSPREMGLGEAESTALVARILQGKPLNEVAYILSTTMEEAHEIVARAARRLLRGCRGETKLTQTPTRGGGGSA